MKPSATWTEPRQAKPSNPWLPCRPKRLGARYRLFCFPYAGGGAQLFRSWCTQLPATIDVREVQLPGRESRIAESAYTDIRPLVVALAEALQPEMDVPFAFFGHSMGALISFELARKLRQQGRRGPMCLFVSACKAPRICATKQPTYNLPLKEFVRELRRLAGTSEDLLVDNDFMELMEPTFRADFELCQTYAYEIEQPLSCPIVTFGGRDDTEVAYEELQAWSTDTTGGFILELEPGGHLFIQTGAPRWLHTVAQTIEGLEISCGGSLRANS